MQRAKSPVTRLVTDIKDLIGASSPPHADLRERLGAVIVLTILVDIGSSFLMLLLEGGLPGSDIHNVWDAFYFTTSQLFTMSSPMHNPVTRVGQAYCILIDLYAITVVSTVAGMFGAFFYHRSDERRRQRESREQSGAGATDKAGNRHEPKTGQP